LLIVPPPSATRLITIVARDANELMGTPLGRELSERAVGGGMFALG
jgi:hypothetical protein